MSNYWDMLAAKTDGQYTAEDFESAAYRLITEQVLYHADKQSRVAYWLVERYARDFERALEPLGVDIMVNDLLRYVYARPAHAKSGAATVTQTLMALVLRAIYEDSARAGQINDNGEVMCDVIELQEKYRLETGRELPLKMEFDANLRTFKRWGILRRADEQNIAEMDSDVDSEMCLLIRPAIRDVLGETALQRLGQWAQTKAVVDVDNNEQESDGVSA